MANTGYTWSAYGFVQKSSSNWTTDAISDTSTETGDSTSIDGKAAALISITCTASAGAIDGDVTIYILGDIDGTNFEDAVYSWPYSVSFRPVNAQTHRILIPVDPRIYKNFKVSIFNDSGQTQTLSVRLATADIAVAN
jgi:hypothetical protein